MLREITKAQLLAYHLGVKKDSGEWVPEHISLAKMNNVDIALEIARVARDIHGANDYKLHHKLWPLLLLHIEDKEEGLLNFHIPSHVIYVSSY